MMTRIAKIGKDWLESPENTCISLVYSPINQAYFVLWMSQVLEIFVDKSEALEYVADTFAV
jgi:hypothetical protein